MLLCYYCVSSPSPSSSKHLFLILTHPQCILFFSSLCVYWLQGRPPTELEQASRDESERTIRRIEEESERTVHHHSSSARKKRGGSRRHIRHRSDREEEEKQIRSLLDRRKNACLASSMNRYIEHSKRQKHYSLQF